MSFSIRQGRASDAAAIARFTAATFDWGDYVADAFLNWIEDPAGQVLVAVDQDDSAVAVGLGLMVSPTEAWLQGARVSEDWRRRGIASAVGAALVEWAGTQQAQVARLVIEDWNVAAQKQVEATGFRAIGSWVVAERSVEETGPTTATNGGQRAKARRKLRIAHSSEAVPAWVSWRSGPFSAPARGLFAQSWRWTRLTVNHLEQAAREGALWQSQAGWAHVRLTADRATVGWLECAPDDAMDMVRSIIDLAAEAGAGAVQITVPEVTCLVDALTAASCELHRVNVYARGL
ncbi:MAG: GNAT family N-acetyltransferase [Actinomycetota bacterium]|nr:GNAT family N-acetyltransferase [Actinomycetota bacterium]